MSGQMNGAEALIGMLSSMGVRHIFGYTGGAVIPFFTKLNEMIIEGREVPKFVLFGQEGAAGHAAEAYSAAAGSAGVVIATSGPGTTNLITPIADAWKDHRSVLFITGQVASGSLCTNAFQEVPTVEITRPVTKASFLVRDAGALESVIAGAMALACSGARGPVVVDVCKDAFMGICSDGYHGQHTDGKTVMDYRSADSVLERLLSASRPVIIAGKGVIDSNAGSLLYQLAQKYDVPVAMTLLGLGSVPARDRLSLGMAGMHGTLHANYAVLNADFILGIGLRFDDRLVTPDFGEQAGIAHVDLHPQERIGRYRAVEFPLKADAAAFLEYAMAYQGAAGDTLQWHSAIDTWRSQARKCVQDDGLIKPQHAIRMISEMMDSDAIVTTGVGQHQMWTAQYANISWPGQLITSGGLGTMGFGLPAAIGAHYARPYSQVVCIDGDGSFRMNMQELSTVADNNVPVKLFLINNHYLGMVRQWEDMLSGGRHHETCMKRKAYCAGGCMQYNSYCAEAGQDIAVLAQSYHGRIGAASVQAPEDLQQAVGHALAYDGPYLLEIRVDPREDVLPMIPPGQAIRNIIR